MVPFYESSSNGKNNNNIDAKRMVRYAAPQYIAGLGDGGSHVNTNMKKNKRLRNPRPQQQQIDDDYELFLRSGEYGNNHNQKTTSSRSKRARDNMYSNSNTWGAWLGGGGGTKTTTATADYDPVEAPWQLSAFALLGAVVLLSALFLHVLADTAAETQTIRQRAQHRRSNSRKAAAAAAAQKKKTKEKIEDDYYEAAAATTTEHWLLGSNDYDEYTNDAARRADPSHPQAQAQVVSSSSQQPPSLYYPYQPSTQLLRRTTAAGAAGGGGGTAAAPTPMYNTSTSTNAAGGGGGYQHRAYNLNPGTTTISTSQQQPASSAANPMTTTTTTTSASNKSPLVPPRAVASPVPTSSSTKPRAPTSRSAAGQQQQHQQHLSPKKTSTTTTLRAQQPPPRPFDAMSPPPPAYKAPARPAVVQQPPPPASKVFSEVSSFESLYDMSDASSFHSSSSATSQQQQQPPLKHSQQHHRGSRALSPLLSGVASDHSDSQPGSGVIVPRDPRLPSTQQQQQTESQQQRFSQHHSPGEAAMLDAPSAHFVEDVGAAQSNISLSMAAASSEEFTESSYVDCLAEETPRRFNGRKTISPEQPSPSLLPSEDNTSSHFDDDMPFLPSLSNSNHQQQPQQQQHATDLPPRPVLLDDLHLMMESGNVPPHWHTTVSDPPPSPVAEANKPPPPAAPVAQESRDSLHFGDEIVKIDDNDISSHGSFAENDPRRNIDHVRGDLTQATNAAASLQGTIDFSELQLIDVIGGGGFGQVWKATWRGTPVAVKVLTGSAQSQKVPRAVLEEFAAEINLLRGMRHPNICLYMGACLKPPNRAIITELAANGSLWDALRLPLNPPYRAVGRPNGLSDEEAWPPALYQADPRHGKPPSFSATRRLQAKSAIAETPAIPPGSWPWVLVKRVASGTASAMVYLHSGQPPVLHRDLKSANILLDESYTPKVCDFGLSRLQSSAGASMTGNCGTVQWMAPEVLANQRYNEKADVFSYGVILWELLTRQCPYEGMGAVQCALAVLNRNHRPSIPLWSPPGLHALIRACLKTDPSERPNFEQILAALQAMP